MTAKPSKSDMQNLSSAVSQLTTAIRHNSSLLEKNTQAVKESENNPAAGANSQEAAKELKEQKKKREEDKKRDRTLLKQMDSMARTLNRYGASMERLSNAVIKTQQDFGVSISSAAKLQTDAMVASFESALAALESVSLEGAGDVMSGVFSGIKQIGAGLLPNEDFGKSFISGIRTIGRELNKPQPGPPLKPFVTRTEYLGAAKDFQNEFGVINTEISNSLAEYAKQYGVSVQQLVQSRRTFLTIAGGDLSRVENLQNRFFNEFSRRGMTPKVALEAITKYADLIARNGTRFADSFARAAADAKKIGVDLAKVDQFGDNIIDNFEGFLESQAELGAMGFGFDSNRLAQIAATGDTGELYRELRSQLAMMGKNINNLTRPERLSLEGMGIDIAAMQRMAGGTPEIAPEKLQEQSNSMLGSILTLMQLGGPLFQALDSLTSAVSTGLSATGEIAKKLAEIIGIIGPVGAIGSALAILAGYVRYKLSKEQYAKVEQYAEEAKKQYSTGNVTEGSKSLAGAALAEISAMEMMPGDAPEAAIIMRYQQLDKELREAAPKYKPGVFGPISPLNELNNFYRVPTFEPSPKTGERYNQRLQNDAFIRGYFYMLRQQQTPLSTVSPVSPLNSLPKKASGGMVRGPGTDKSDSIPARLSNGEYVVNADAVRRIGVSRLDAMNNGRHDTMSGTSGLDYNKIGQRSLTAIEMLHAISDKNARDALMRQMSGVGGIELYKHIPKKIETVFGTVGKAPALVRYLAPSAGRTPLIGALLGGGLEGINEYKQTGSVSRGVGKGVTSATGGVLGAALGLRFGKNPIVSATLAALGSSAGEELFDIMFPRLQMKDGGLVGTLKSTAMNKGMNFLSNRIPGLSGVMDSVKTGGVKGGLMNAGMNFLSKRVPGLSGAMDAFSAFKTGGVRGALGSLAKGGIGKMIGGAIGSAIPIPGVGTAIGSLMGSKVGKLVGGLFARRKQPIAQQLMGALPNVAGFAGNLIGRVPGMERFNPEGFLRNMAEQPKAQAAVQTVVDTTGIEQKLNNFITALNNMNIVMDGAKVGKVLVNASDAATTVGVFRPMTRATL